MINGAPFMKHFEKTCPRQINQLKIAIIFIGNPANNSQEVNFQACFCCLMLLSKKIRFTFIIVTSPRSTIEAAAKRCLLEPRGGQYGQSSKS